MSEREVMTWDDLGDGARELAELVHADGYEPDIILAIARRIGEPRILLTGGCFQNRYLVERAVRRLSDAGFLPYWHQRVPPNDGGIALGQVVAAARSHLAIAQDEKKRKTENEHVSGHSGKTY